MARVIRAPNHLGDLIMALPALAAVGEADVLVEHGLAPLASLGLGGQRVIPFERGRQGFLDATRRLRRGRYELGVILPPSFSSALLFRAGAVRQCRGLATDGRRLLLTDPVPREAIRKLHRVSAYLFLVTGMAPPVPPAPCLGLPPELLERGAAFIDSGGRRTVGVFPGSNASSRRWDPERFRAVVQRMVDKGDHVVVFGGPSETALTAFVAGDAAVDAGGQTDLPLLAAALAACDILLSNDSGPLHVAAAVGTPTVSLQGASNPAVTGVVGTQHRFLRRADLACVPCVRNVCPRRGPGYLLPEAQRECLRLIEVQDVLAAVSPST